MFFDHHLSMMHLPNETCRMSGSSIFSPGVMPVVALWYWFSNTAAGRCSAAEDESALHRVAIIVLYMLPDCFPWKKPACCMGEKKHKQEAFSNKCWMS